MSILTLGCTQVGFSGILQARKKKFDRVKGLGSPIELSGKPLDLLVRDNDLWVAESSSVARKLDLEVSGADITLLLSGVLTLHRQELFSKRTRATRAQ